MTTITTTEQNEMTLNDKLLQLTARRREIRDRLHRCPWPALAEQLRAELVHVGDELLRLDCVTQQQQRQILTGEYDDAYCFPLTSTGAAK